MAAPQPAQSIRQGKVGSMTTDQGALPSRKAPAAFRSGHSSSLPWITKFSKSFFSTRLSMSAYILRISRRQLLSGSAITRWSSS